MIVANSLIAHALYPHLSQQWAAIAYSARSTAGRYAVVAGTFQ
jgi:hypothetical protein